MKIKQFLFLLILCSLIVTNFTHPMDNSLTKKTQTLMTELGVKCWEVIWKNPELLKSSITDEAYRYCEAGYKNSKISMGDVCEALYFYLPGSPDEKAIKIASNMKINDKVANVIVNNLNPNNYLLDENYKPFSNITDKDNILLLKKIFYNKLRSSNRKRGKPYHGCYKTSKETFERKWYRKDEEANFGKFNSQLGIFHLTRIPSVMNENDIEGSFSHVNKHGINWWSEKHPYCIDSSEQFMVVCYDGSDQGIPIYNGRLKRNVVKIDDIRTRQRLLNIYLLPDPKSCGEYTPVNISDIKLSDNGSVLFLKSGSANKKIFSIVLIYQ